jgi:phage/plasmid-like protein (TIGR03299 family)
MGHGIEQGDRVIYIGDKPWHDLGTEMPEGLRFDIRGALAFANMTYEVRVGRGYYRCPVTNNVVKMDTCPVIRMDTGARLGEVSGNWRPHQIVDTFERFAPFVGEGKASVETAGTLFSGRKAWLLLRLPGADLDVGGGDTVKRYLRASTGFDGATATRIGFCATRTVCNNTLEAGDAEGSFLRVLHTKGSEQAITDAVESINVANRTFEATAEQWRAMAAKGVNTDDLRRYVKLVFKPKKSELDAPELQGDPEAIAELLASQKDGAPRIEAKITELFETGRGAELTTARGTVWGLYNAVAEYLTWCRGKSVDNRLDNLWFDGALLRRAHAEAMKIVEGAA